MISEKAKSVAKSDALKTINAKCSGLTNAQVEQLADELVNKIDWDNTALMHKSLDWITEEFLKRKGFV